MDTKILNRILTMFLKYKYRVIFTFICSVVSVVSFLLLPVQFGKAVDTFSNGRNVDFERLKIILIGLTFTVIIGSLSTWMMNALNNSVVFSVVKDIRDSAFEKLQRLNISYVDSNQHGDIVSKIINDTDQFSEGLLVGATQFIGGILTIIISLVFMFSINKIMMLIVIVLTPVSIIIAGFISKSSYKYFKEQTMRNGLMSAEIEEDIEGISTIKNYCMEENVYNKFTEKNEKLRTASINALFFSALTFPSVRLINAIISAIVGTTGAIFVISDLLSVGQFISFTSYATCYAKPFNEMAGVLTELQNAIACAARVFSVIDEEEIIPDDIKSKELNVKEGKVEFKNVYFSYDKNRQLIKNLNFEARPGKKIAIVGPTGCGKTTLINLLMRFYELDSGNIDIDNQDITSVKRSSLVSSFGMVLQDTWLKSGTIKENIAMGNKDASDEDIINAAKLASADSFITRLPDEYNTLVNEGGSNLSAGERQLLCIARIILAKPHMLILDEATSSIDTRTEVNVTRVFDKLMEGRTSFIVAHRLSTIKEADVIVVMKDGEIIETGNHEELLEKDGFYKKLYLAQAQ